MVVLPSTSLVTVLEICLVDHGFLVLRKFFETSHVKEELDATAANVRQKVSYAVLTAAIRNAIRI